MPRCRDARPPEEASNQFGAQDRPQFGALRLTAAANVETIVRAGIHVFPHDVIDAMNVGATRIAK
jgi:hypothetical protein